MDKKKLASVLSVLLALALWQGAAVLVGSEMLLASPIRVIARLAVIWKEPGFASTVLFSFTHIAAGFLLAFFLGTVLGIFAGRFELVETLLKPYVVTIKAVPVASFIILCLIWLEFNTLTVLIAFLIAFPVIYSNVLQGYRSADGKMKELCAVYRVARGRQLVYVYLPAIRPYLISAARIGAGMAWKAGVAAEVIGIVGGSIGEMLYQSKIYFLNADLLSWTVIIIILGALTEKLAVALLKFAFRAVEKL